MGKFEIKKRKNGEFQFDLKADNGQVILTSEGYTTREACKNGIESVKKNAIDLRKYDKLISSNGRYYFNLKASNGQIIGTSEMYTSEPDRDRCIEKIADIVNFADVEDAI